MIDKTYISLGIVNYQLEFNSLLNQLIFLRRITGANKSFTFLFKSSDSYLLICSTIAITVSVEKSKTY